MNEPEPVWCVKEQHGPWHGTASGYAYDRDHTIVGTMCRNNVYREPTRRNEQQRLPDCERCLATLERRAKRQAGIEDSKKQGVLF